MDEGDVARGRGQRMVVFLDNPTSNTGDSKGIELLPIAQAAHFEFVGPPMIKTVYVPLPRDPRRLVPYAAYEEELVRDKYNEALRVVGMLGASEIRAVAYKGSQSSGRAGVEARGVGRLGLGTDKSDSYDVTYEQKGEGGPPQDPHPLGYPGEPGFEAACVAVLNNGAQEVRIEIVRQSTLSIDGEIASSLKQAGFKLGSAGERSRYSTFVIQAKFNPAMRGTPAPSDGTRKRWLS